VSCVGKLVLSRRRCPFWRCGSSRVAVTLNVRRCCRRRKEPPTAEWTDVDASSLLDVPLLGQHADVAVNSWIPSAVAFVAGNCWMLHGARYRELWLVLFSVHAVVCAIIFFLCELMWPWFETTSHLWRGCHWYGRYFALYCAFVQIPRVFDLLICAVIICRELLAVISARIAVVPVVY